MVSESGDPATAEWREAMGASASAQLRQTQQALAASQADLTRVAKERDEARAAVADVEKHRKITAERLTRAETERDEARAEAKEMRAQAELYLAQRDDALHDLARARFHHAHCTAQES